MNNEDLIEAVNYLKKSKMSKGSIAEKLGIHPGYLSDLLNNRKPVSEQMRARFKRAFGIDLGGEKGEIIVSRGGEKISEEPTVPLSVYNDLDRKYRSSLEKDKDFLQRMLESSLITIANAQLDIHAHLKAVLENEADKASNGDRKKKTTEMLRLSRSVAAHKEGLKQAGSPAALDTVDRT